MLQRQKQKILLCKRDELRNDVEIFQKPEPIYINFVDLTSTYLIETVGNFDKEYKVAKVTEFTADKFNTGDRCYIEKVPEDITDELCLDADYIVKSKKKVGSVIELLFEGLL